MVLFFFFLILLNLSFQFHYLKYAFQLHIKDLLIFFLQIHIVQGNIIKNYIIILKDIFSFIKLASIGSNTYESSFFISFLKGDGITGLFGNFFGDDLLQISLETLSKSLLKVSTSLDKVLNLFLSFLFF